MDREAMRQSMAAMRQQLKAGVQVVAASQLFPTPPAIARRMVEIVNPQAGDRVLEPSAGTGSILQVLRDAAPDSWRVAVEINGRLCEGLRGIDHKAKVIPMDFLQWEPMDSYNCIVMNPPFERGADIEHIRHALSMLAFDGRMVAICAGGPRQHDQLLPLVDEYGGGWEKLPAGTFSDQGTNVNTLLLTFGCEL